MITILILLLLVFAIAGGFAIHPLLFLVVLLAVALLLSDRRNRVP